jgi:ABC-type transport system involved in multi-copper enzyme maturation permease subunit
MTADLGRVAPRAATTSAPLVSRIYGLGSVYGKTLRDSRLAILIMSGLLSSLVLAAGADYGKTYATVEARAGFVNLVRHLPAVLAGIYGDPSPANLETLGGMISLKVAASVAVICSLWSILALSSTLAGEARRGSLEFVLVTPLGPRLIAFEKLAAHGTSLAIVLTVLAVASWLAGAAFGTLPGDDVSAEAAIGFSLWAGVMALASGSVAFALAPLIGRNSAAGVAGAVTVGGMLVYGYQASVPAFSVLANGTWFGWTAQNQPLAGQFDWPALVPVALVAALFFVLGVEAFARRDLGQTTAIPWLRFPAATLGLRGPLGRSLGERLPLALAWGAGIGLFGMGLGAAASSFGGTIADASPESLKLFNTLFPKIDLTTAGGFLQLAFVELGFIFAGFAASTLVSGWASDESSGRLELLLTAPLARARWAISTGLGVMAAIAVMTAVIALGIGIGAETAGSDVLTPILGTLVLGLYAAALAGVGLAVGGLLRPSIAAEVVAAVVIITFVVELTAPALKLPGWVIQLALTDHMGQPMIGSWDWTGITACAVLALGGLALSAWGISRRDVAT